MKQKKITEYIEYSESHRHLEEPWFKYKNRLMNFAKAYLRERVREPAHVIERYVMAALVEFECKYSKELSLKYAEKILIEEYLEEVIEKINAKRYRSTYYPESEIYPLIPWIVSPFNLNTLSLKNLVNRAQPTCPKGIKAYSYMWWLNFLNEHSVKYSILLKLWSQGYIAYPEVEVRDARFDIALLDKRDHVIVIECKSALYKGTLKEDLRLFNYYNYCDFIFKIAPYTEQHYKDILKYKNTWTNNLTESISQLYGLECSDMRRVIDGLGRALIDIEKGRIVEITRAKRIFGPYVDEVKAVLKSKHYTCPSQFHDTIVAIVAKHFIDKGFGVAFEQTLPFAGQRYIQLGYSPWGPSPAYPWYTGVPYIREVKRGHQRIDLVAIDPQGLNIIGIEVKGYLSRKYGAYESPEKVREQLREYLYSRNLSKLYLAIPKNLEDEGLKVAKEVSESIGVIVVDVDSKSVKVIKEAM